MGAVAETGGRAEARPSLPCFHARIIFHSLPSSLFSVCSFYYRFGLKKINTGHSQSLCLFHFVFFEEMYGWESMVSQETNAPLSREKLCLDLRADFPEVERKCPLARRRSYRECSLLENKKPRQVFPPRTESAQNLYHIYSEGTFESQIRGALRALSLCKRCCFCCQRKMWIFCQ